MPKKINTHKLKRDDVYKDGEILISRHYWISDKIHIELIKISSTSKKNISYHVRKGLTEYINNQKQLSIKKEK